MRCNTHYSITKLIHISKGRFIKVFNYDDCVKLRSLNSPIVFNFLTIYQENQISVISIVMEYAECGDLAQRIQKQREVEKTYFPEVRPSSFAK